MDPTIRFNTDEQVANAVVQGLRQRGVDVQTVSEAGLRGATDQDHLSWAYQHQRVLLTQDTDFLRLHASGLSHAGIVFAAQGTSVSEMVRGLMLIHQILKHPETGRNVRACGIFIRDFNLHSAEYFGVQPSPKVMRMASVLYGPGSMAQSDPQLIPVP